MTTTETHLSIEDRNSDQIDLPAIPSWLKLDGVTEEDRQLAAQLTRRIHIDLAHGLQPSSGDIGEAAALLETLELAGCRAMRELAHDLGDLDPDDKFRVAYYDGAQHLIDGITGAQSLFGVLGVYTDRVDPDAIGCRVREQVDAEAAQATGEPCGEAALPPRAEYIAAANGLAAAARELMPLIASVRELMGAVDALGDRSRTVEDDAQLERLRSERGEDVLSSVVFAFGQLFSDLPLVDGQLHCTVTDPEALTQRYT